MIDDEYRTSTHRHGHNVFGIAVTRQRLQQIGRALKKYPEPDGEIGSQDGRRWTPAFGKQWGN
jgi:hypothetical protein